MTFHVTNRQGASHVNATADTIDRVLAELDGVVDIEHPDVSLTHESGWTLSAFPSGLVVWENVESDTEPRHRREVSRAEVRRLWLTLAEGDVASVEAHGWDQGHGAVTMPPRLADLLPLADVWGISDDVEREAAVDRADLDELERLVRAVDDAEDIGLYDWLTGEASYAAMPSREYVSMTCLTMAADAARLRLLRER